MESKILACLINDRNNYEKVIEHLNRREFTQEGDLILNEIVEFYNSDEEAQSCDKDIIAARLERRLQNPKHHDRMRGLLMSLPNVSGANVVREVLELKCQNIGLELGQRILAGDTSGKSLRPLLEQYTSLLDRTSLDEKEENEEIQAPKVADVIRKITDPSRLIKLLPKSLNERVDGGVYPGNHIVVFAPVEMGKSLFMINMVYGFLKQGFKTLYVGNEDPADAMILRIISRLSGMTKYDIRNSPDEVQSIIDQKGYDNLVFAELSPGTFPRIESLCNKYEPKIVILDQLSNIKCGRAEDSKTGSLEEAAKEARALAKRRDILVVSVVQAADSATGKSVLGRGDIHNSNIGIPGQADLMIGIGATLDMEQRNMREVSIIKNKVNGNHEHFTVSIDPTLSKVID